MQFRQVHIEGEERFVFAFTKREAEVFRQATRNKKAPMDERVIRFVASRGIMWATDRHQLVALTAKSDYEPRPEWPDIEFAIHAHELKSFAAKAKVTELLVVDCSTLAIGSIPKMDLFDGMTITPTRIGVLTRATDFDLTTANLDVVLSSVPADVEEDEVGARRWAMSSRFGSTLAAMAKATGEANAIVFVNPATATAGARWVAGDDVDGARWDLVVMPVMPHAVGPV